MNRPTSLRITPRHADLLKRIRAWKAEPPVWGSRRLWAYCHCVEKLPVNQQRRLRLRRAHPRLVPPHLRWRATRTPLRSQPKPTKPHA
jgi:hypothetical protein